MNLRLLGVSSVVAMLMSVAAPVVANDKLHIYNWSDYIAEDTIANFEKETGIKVSYDVYDSNEVLEAKLLAGRSGYDLVFPSAQPFAGRALAAKLYRPFDLAKLTNYKNLDPTIMKTLVGIDPKNDHLIPYMWGTTGIAYNVDKVKAILGKDMPLDTWRLVFDPAIVSKLSSCGVALMDDALEVFVAARIYKGLPTDVYSKEAIAEAAEVIGAVRPHVRYFHNSQTVNDIANGDICVAMGFSGDLLQGQARAKEAGKGVNVQYIVPREGAVLFTDVAAIPADAKNVEAAHKFINYVLRPDVIAPISNYVAYANANSKATELVDTEIRNNPGIYPKPETVAKLIVFKTPSDREARDLTRAWTRAKTGR